MHSLVLRVQRLQTIAVFECAGRLGSFTAAARALGMNQSAVSRHIGALERALGQQLFTRSPNRVALNANGRLLVAAIQNGFDTIDQVLDAITSAGPTVLLAANPGFAQQWLVPYLDQLQAFLGDPVLRLRPFDRDAELASDQFDVAIHLTPVAAAPPGSRVLFDERVVPVAAPEFADAAELDDRSDPKDLLDLAKLHLDTRDRSWTNWATWFATHDLYWKPSQARLSYNNYALVMSDAIAGRGIALAWRGLVDGLVDAGALVPVGPEVHHPDMAYQVIPGPSSPPGAVDQVADWLLNLMN